MRLPSTQLSRISGQSVNAIAEEALRAYVGWRVPQLLDLEQAIRAADQGDFASDDEVSQLFRRYGA